MLTEQEWEVELRRALGCAVRVRYGRSRSSPIQLRGARPAEIRELPELRDGWVIRLHRIFAEAPTGVRDDLCRWIRAGRRARRASRDLGRWTEERLAALPEKPPPRTRVEPGGERHDLESIRDELLAEHFREDFDLFRPVPPVTWGRRRRSRTRGRLHLGSYSPRTGIVRLHPVLDGPAVPRWFVRYVLFHELLHAALPEERDGRGRLLTHGPTFRRREREYPDYAGALAWETRHLAALLRAARRGGSLGAPRR